MAIRPILTTPDPRLKTVSRKVVTLDKSVRTLMDDMLETMYAANGIGLAAIQVGEPLQVIVMDLAREGDAPEPRYFVNPEILETSEDTVVCEEGCLSVPEFFEEVERPSACTVRYLDYEGQAQEIETDGLLATCLQHEIDHLSGILFLDHLSRLKRNMIVRKLAKAKRQNAVA